MGINEENLYTNKRMKKYFKDQKNIPLRHKEILKARIFESIEKSFEDNIDGGEYIVIDDLCEKEEILRKFNDLVEYEYACNEIYWAGQEISYRYRGCIRAILELIIQAIQSKYQNKTFIVYVFMQSGLSGWIQTRFHLNRNGEIPLDLQLDNYQHSVLYYILKT